MESCKYQYWVWETYMNLYDTYRYCMDRMMFIVKRKQILMRDNFKNSHIIHCTCMSQTPISFPNINQLYHYIILAILKWKAELSQIIPLDNLVGH